MVKKINRDILQHKKNKTGKLKLQNKMSKYYTTESI